MLTAAQKAFCLPISLLMLSAAFPSGAAKAEEELPYRIAVIVPQTGPVATLGGYVQKGLQLAYNNLPEDRKSALDLVFEDDRFDPKQSVSAYQSISNRNPVDGVIVVASPPGNALAPITEQKKQILVAVGASDPSIIKARKFAFIHWVTPEAEGEVLVNELLKRGRQRIGFVTAEVSGTIADRDAAVEYLRKAGAEDRIVYNQTFSINETDFRTPIAQLKAKKADSVVLIVFADALASFLKQARDLKLEAEITGEESFEDDYFVKAAQGTALGKWYVNANDPTDQFVSLYRSAYGEQPGWAAGNAFDTLMLISEAVRRYGRDNERIRAYLSSIKDYQGAAGTYSSTGDNRFTLPAAVKEITEKGFVKVR